MTEIESTIRDTIKDIEMAARGGIAANTALFLAKQKLVYVLEVIAKDGKA